MSGQIRASTFSGFRHGLANCRWQGSGYCGGFFPCRLGMEHEVATVICRLKDMAATRRRSRRAVFILALPKTSAHAAKLGLRAMMTLLGSYSLPGRWRRNAPPDALDGGLTISSRMNDGASARLKTAASWHFRASWSTNLKLLARTVEDPAPPFGAASPATPAVAASPVLHQDRNRTTSMVHIKIWPRSAHHHPGQRCCVSRKE